MGLESPVRRSIHTSGCECSKAKLGRAGGDVLSHFLQVCKGFDIINGITSLLK